MNIAMGLDGADGERGLYAFAEAGCDEFFAGFIPPEWSDTFGWEYSLNRRAYGAQCQFTDIDDLRQAVSTVHDLGKRISLTFNVHEHPDAIAPLVRDIIMRVEELEPDSYTVADPALMLLLREWGIERPLHLSTGTACFNSETIRYYCSIANVRRVVIPRKMTLREMESLISSARDLDLEFEVMVLGYRCIFNDEFCFSVHCGLEENLCVDFGAAEALVGRRLANDWKQRIEDILADLPSQFAEGSLLDRWRKELAVDPRRGDLPAPGAEDTKTPGLSSTVAQILLIHCGLCAVPRLREIGVTTLKLPLRGATWQKQEHLRLLRTVLDHPDPTPEFCRELVNSPGFCARCGSCYYHVDGEGE